MLAQIVGYVPSTVVPAIVSFAMIYAYTHLLTPAEYGDFSLAFSAVLVAQTSFFFAIPVALTRFYPEARAAGRQDAFLAECYTLLYVLSAITVALTGVASALPIDTSTLLWGLAVLLLLARSTVVVNQSVNRITFRVMRFSIIECSHAVLGLGLSLFFIYWLGASAEAVLLGLFVAAALCMLADIRTVLLPLRQDWRQISRPAILRLVRFSLPLIALDITVCLLQLSDRFLLETLGGAEALGIYTVAYNLVERPTSLICSAISTATFPIAVQTLQDHGPEAGGRQVQRNGVVLFAMVVPACVGLAMTAPYITAVMIGSAFRPGVTALIPVMCVAALFRGISNHFIDHMFHLSAQTRLALWVYAPAAAANIALNLVLIPRYGMFGAAWAALVCQAGSVVAGWVISQRAFTVALPTRDLVKVLIASLPMGMLLAAVTFASSWVGLLEAVGSGGLTFIASAVALDVGGARGSALRLIRHVPIAVHKLFVRPAAMR